MSKVILAKEDTPLVKVLGYALEGYKRPLGKPPTTWVSTVKRDLEKVGLTWEEACTIIKRDKNKWLQIINILWNRLWFFIPYNQIELNSSEWIHHEYYMTWEWHDVIASSLRISIYKIILFYYKSGQPFCYYKAGQNYYKSWQLIYYKSGNLLQIVSININLGTTYTKVVLERSTKQLLLILNSQSSRLLVDSSSY